MAIRSLSDPSGGRAALRTAGVTDCHRPDGPRNDELEIATALWPRNDELDQRHPEERSDVGIYRFERKSKA